MSAAMSIALARDRLGVQALDVDQRAGRRQRIVAARADGDDAAFGSSTSPVPESSSETSLSATAIIASSRRR
jgi:hypothetical protein